MVVEEGLSLSLSLTLKRNLGYLDDMERTNQCFVGPVLKAQVVGHHMDRIVAIDFFFFLEKMKERERLLELRFKLYRV